MTGDRPSTQAEALEATPTDLTLADVLEAAADETAGVARGRDGDATTFSAGSPAIVFATLAGDRAELHLDPQVARAALRTPATGPSPRGAGWVGFAPPVVDDGAVDRAEAWFLSAHRRATTPDRTR